MALRFLVVLMAFGSFTSLVNAQEIISQNIVLSPGWNIISTPKVLESHQFSAPETSENYDIYILDASSPTGWVTMSDLGQTEFEPLYGYFVQNKTGLQQSLTFNYDTVLEPNEKLFERSFLTTGWYSIGVANDEYAKSQNADRTDTDNPSKILSLLAGKYDLLIDFTDAQYDSSRRSVAINDPWKAAVPTDIDKLNDFRDTKGYAIYIKEGNTSYSGFQNDPVLEPTIAELSIETSANDPDATTFELDKDNKVEITPFVFNLNTRSSTEDITVTKIEINATGTTDITNYIDDVALIVGGEDITSDVTITSTSFTFEFVEGDFVIEAGEQAEVYLSVLFNALDPDQEGEVVRFSVTSAGVDSEADDDILASGSVVGDSHTLRTSGLLVYLDSENVDVTTGDNSLDDYATYTMELEVTAFGEDVFISEDSGLSVSYVIQDGGGSPVISGTRSVSLSSTADESSGYFVINEGETENLILTVTYSPGVANTVARLVLKSISFANTAIPPTKTQETLPESEFRTSIVTIVN